MLLITFHAAPGTVIAYPDGGGEPTGVLDPPPTSHVELRGLALVPGGLWVVNATRGQSAILGYAGSGRQYKPATAPTVIDHETDPFAEALWHPFEFTFDADGSTTYVSNQDTNVVARYAHDPSFTTLTELPENAKLPAGDYLRSTFAASDGDPPGVKATTPVPSKDGGLKFHVDEKLDPPAVDHSVRGVLWTNDALYVADEWAGVVRVYDHEGNYLGHGSKLASPVHLLRIADLLLVSARRGIFAAKLHADDPAKLEFPDDKNPTVPLAGASGMALSPDGALYAANRDASTVHVYRSETQDGKLVKAGEPFPVLERPEFVLYVPNG
jgi:hypothetical protein